MNIGPKADGTIPTKAVAILNDFAEITQKYNSEIFGTTASKFSELNFKGKSNTVVGKKNTRLNFFIYEYPEDGKIILDGLENKICKAYITSTKSELKYILNEQKQ